MKKLFFIFLTIQSFIHAYDIHLYHHKDHLSEELMSHMKQVFQVDTLVETGTYSGDTCLRALPYFNKIYTVEIHPSIFKKTNKVLSNYPNVKAYLDNSYNFLCYPEIKQLKKPLFWLDAHYCGVGTGALYSKEKKIISPLKQEITLILNYLPSSGIILIDDLRGYPNLSSSYRKSLTRIYTTISEIKNLINNASDFCFYVLGDMGIIFNKKVFKHLSISPAVKACTTSYCFDPFESVSFQQVRNVLQAELYLAEAKNEQLEKTINALYTTYFHDHIFQYILWKGLRSMGKGQYHEALTYLKSLLTIDPFYFYNRAYLYIAKCYKELEEFEHMNYFLDLVSKQNQAHIDFVLNWKPNSI